MTKSIFYYVVTVLGVIFFIFSVQFKKKKDILIVQTLASIFYMISYYMIGAYTGFATEFVEEIKDMTLVYYENKHKKVPLLFLILFLLVLVLIGVFTYEGIYTLIPIIINLAYFIATYMKNPKYIRLIVLICGILWAIYNFTAGAYVIIIGNMFEIISAAIALKRYKNYDR